MNLVQYVPIMIRYFWDSAHLQSNFHREANTDPEHQQLMQMNLRLMQLQHQIHQRMLQSQPIQPQQSQQIQQSQTPQLIQPREQQQKDAVAVESETVVATVPATPETASDEESAADEEPAEERAEE